MRSTSEAQRGRISFVGSGRSMLSVGVLLQETTAYLYEPVRGPYT